jgi:hypothetical protein
MSIGQNERQGIAARLAASLPGWSDREAVAAAAGLRDVQLTGKASQAWLMLVDEAVEQDKLERLVRVAARRFPDDAALQRLANDVEAGRMPGGVPRGVLIGVALVFVAAVGWWALGGAAEQPAATLEGVADARGGDVPAPAPARVETPARAPSARVAQAPSQEVVESPSVTTAPAVAVAETPSPTPPPLTIPTSPPVSAPIRASLASASAAGGPCDGQVGFAFLGETTSLSAGDTWTASRAINVRADYPRSDNGWSSRTEVLCVLPKGATVRLDQAPVAVDGGVFWLRVDGASASAP